MRGFTIPEIAVVIATITILFGITFAAFNQVQMQGRDNKRRADIIILKNELDKYYEKNGNYPIGCDTSYTHTCADQASTYASMFPGSTIPPLVGSSTTTADLQAILPGIPDDFGDPKQKSDTPINQIASTVINPYSYVLLSQDTMSWSTSMFLGTSPTTFISCDTNEYQYDYAGVYRGDRPHDYILAYYSEMQAKWIFINGPHLSSLNNSRWNYNDKPECVPTVL